MSINDDVYQVLYKIGLNEDEIKELFQKNIDLSTVLDEDVTQMIEFYKTYGLSEQEIADIERKNPWFLTESFARIRYLEEDYKRVGIEEIGELLRKHPIAMSINPMHLYDMINKNLGEGREINEIKEMIVKDYEKYFSI